MCLCVWRESCDENDDNYLKTNEMKMKSTYTFIGLNNLIRLFFHNVNFQNRIIFKKMQFCTDKIQGNI